MLVPVKILAKGYEIEQGFLNEGFLPKYIRRCIPVIPDSSKHPPPHQSNATCSVFFAFLAAIVAVWC